MELRLHPEPLSPAYPWQGRVSPKRRGSHGRGAGPWRWKGGPFQPPRGRGGIRGARGNRGGNVGGKRKADVFNQPDSKRRQTANQQTGARSPSPSSPCSRAPTTPPATATATTRTSSPRTPTASSGSSRAARPRPEKLVRDWPAVFV